MCETGSVEYMIKAAPKCSDEGTIKTAIDIFRAEALKSLPGLELLVTMDGIRTNGSDDKTGAQFCAGQGSISFPALPQVPGTTFPITFTSVLTDKKGAVCNGQMAVNKSL